MIHFHACAYDLAEVSTSHPRYPLPDSTASGMASRPLVYTALTRARQHLSVVQGLGMGLSRAIRDVGARPRRSALRDFLQ